jgi:hypothetical protein
VGWYLNNALTTYREEVNAAYPHRDQGSDGTVGDEAHQSGSSDHNPDSDGSVDAWDMDVEVNGKGAAWADDVEHLKAVFQAHPAAQYWIHDREIANRDYGWDRRYYDGSNPHDKHVHWNSRSSHEDSTQPWGVDSGVSEKDVIDGLHDPQGWQQPGVAERMKAEGWTGEYSHRVLTEYNFEGVRDMNATLGAIAVALTDIGMKLGVPTNIPPPPPIDPPPPGPADAAAQD